MMRTNIVYLVVWEVTFDRWEGYALADDDGYVLAYVKGETPEQVWFDLEKFDQRFLQHYPDGYDTLRLTLEEADRHHGYQKAYNKNRL